MKKQLSELKKLSPGLKYISPDPSKSAKFASLIAFSDAAFRSSSYGQTGHVGGIFLELDSSRNIYHIIDWHCGKQRRVYFQVTISALQNRKEMKEGSLNDLYKHTDDVQVNNETFLEDFYHETETVEHEEMYESTRMRSLLRCIAGN